MEYLATLTPAGSTITKTSAAGEVDAKISSTTRAWKAIVIGGASLEDHDAIEVTGRRAAVKALVDSTRL